MTVQLLAVIFRGLLYVAGAILIAEQWRTRPDRWERALAWMIALLHGSTYTVVYSVDYYAGEGVVNGLFYNDWARILWLHIMIVFVSVEAVRLWHLRTRGARWMLTLQR